jgi:hypothetical protein
MGRSTFTRVDELMADLVLAAYKVNFLWISLTLAEYRIRDKPESIASWRRLRGAGSQLLISVQ